MEPSRRLFNKRFLVIILLLNACFTFMPASNTAARPGGQEQGWSLALLTKDNALPAANDRFFTYSTPGDASGIDELTYRINAEGRESNHAKVTITIQMQSGEQPVAQDDSYVVEQNQALDVPQPGILANDYDPRGKKLKAELIDQPLGGGLVHGEDGSFTYIPAANFAGPVHFTYRVKAASLYSNVATVSISVIDVTAPTVQWTGEFEEGGVYHVRDGRLLLTASAADNFSLREVVFYRWDAIIEEFFILGADAVAPFELEIDTGELNTEWNQVFVRAYDSFDNISESPFIWLYRLVTAAELFEFLPVVVHH